MEDLELAYRLLREFKEGKFPEGRILSDDVRFPRFFVCQRVSFMLPVSPDAAL